MVSQREIHQRIDQLKSVPRYTEILTSEVEIIPPEPQPTAGTSSSSSSLPPPAKKLRRSTRKAGEEAPSTSAPAPVPAPAPPPPPTPAPSEDVKPREETREEKEEKLIAEGKMVGKIPPYPTGLDYHPPDLLYGFNHQAELTRLKAYLALNGNFVLKSTPCDGACLFNAVLSQLGCEQEYTQIHLRRDLMLLVCDHPEYFYWKLAPLIQSQYGEFEEDQPGPFSFVTWITAMLKGDFWGDASIIQVLQRWFMLPLCVINGNTLVIERYLNTFSLPKQELVLIFVGKDHYMGAVKYDIFTEPNTNQDYDSPCPLECLPLHAYGDYKLEDEDHRVFQNLDQTKFRRWPETPYPQAPAAPQVIPPPHPDPDCESRQDKMKKFLDQLEEKVIGEIKFLKANGRDPVKKMKDNDSTTKFNQMQKDEKICSVCERGFHSHHYLKKHFRKAHMHQDAYKCSVCPETFIDKATLRNHCINKHGSDPSNPTTPSQLFTCDECGWKTRLLAEFNRHKKEHRANFKCEHCDKPFSHKKGLVDHVKKSCKVLQAKKEKEAKEKGEKPSSSRVQCEHCPKDFAHERSLAHHMKEKHPDV